MERQSTLRSNASRVLALVGLAGDIHWALSLLSFSGAAIVTAPIGTAAWAVFHVPLPLLVLFLAGIFGVSLVTISQFLIRREVRIASLPRRRGNAEFYDGRPMVNRLRGGLVEEIQTVESAWLATQTGDHPTANGVFETQCIKRLILCHPNGGHMTGLASAAGRDRLAAASTITDSTQQATGAGVKVRWYDGPIAPMLFGDPHLETAWVRVEVPFGFTAVRPGFLVRKAENEGLFLALKESFEKMWEKSIEPNLHELASRTEGSPPR